MSSSSTRYPVAEGPGSVSQAPQRPAGFTDTFTSRNVDVGGLRQHAVIGGDGPPLLLVHGWPENWCAWRLLMPALARDFEVIAVDQPGMGLSDKPQVGQRKSRPLTMPVLAIGGAESWGKLAGEGIKPAANEVQTVVIPGTGYWVAETAPEEMLAALTAFPAPYREGGGGLSSASF
jgi:pimeloyl-ACP methyl ester carboxylesterase